MPAGRPRVQDDPRECRECGKKKPLTDFPKAGSGGRRTICKPCYSEAQKARYHGTQVKQPVAVKPLSAARRKRWYKLCAERWEAAQQRWIERMMEKAG